MCRRHTKILKPIIAVVFLLAITTSARGAYFAGDFPLTFGSWWRGVILAPDEMDIMQPAGSREMGVFESIVYDGHNAVKLGDPSNFKIASKNGNLVTMHGYFEEGVEYNHTDLQVGEVIDGALMQTEYFTVLLREFNQIPSSLWPDLRFAQYGDLAESYLRTPGLIFIVSFSDHSQKNELNEIVEYGLSSNITTNISTGVSHITFYAPGIGQVLAVDIDSASGKVREVGVLTEYYIAPET
jgi:hypothetical protein